MPFTKTLATATASALLAGGAVAYTGVAATTHAPAKAKHPPQTVGQKRERRQARLAANRAALAQRLGVTSDQLAAAQDTLFKQALDRRVSAGTLTTAQRTAIMACRAAPLSCDRTDLPARAHSRKAQARRAERRRANAGRRMERRATALAAQLHLDRAKVLSALEAQRKAHRDR